MTAVDALLGYHLGATVTSSSKELNVAQQTTLSLLRNHPLYEHPVMLCLDGLAALIEGTFIHSTYSPGLDLTTQYLCTGLDIYSTVEPDLFVSMALLHSRIKSVVYKESLNNGALGSLYKLHCLNDINHRFQVFKWQDFV